MEEDEQDMLANDEAKKQAEIIVTGKTCRSPMCIMSTPFGLATYFIGLMVIIFTDWPEQILGFLTLATGFIYTYAFRRCS